MTFDQLNPDIKTWLVEENLTLSVLNDPSVLTRQTLGVVLDGRNAGQKALFLTLVSLLSGTVQKFEIQIIWPNGQNDEQVKMWIQNSHRIEFVTSPEAVNLRNDLLLVVPAGVIFGRYSVEAVVEAKHVTGCEVLRAVVDGADYGLELWSSEPLHEATDRSTAEAEVRKRGGERWVSGSSLGLRFMGKPAPKQFLRKGAAEQLEQTVVVRDLRDPETRIDYEEKIRVLEAELQRRRRPAGTSGPSRSFPRRFIVVVRKGPKYIASRLSQRVPKLSKWL